MLASRSENDALAGTLFFNVAHYALRPWPWIIVALASMLVYPTVADIQRAFPYVDPALLGNDMAYPAMLRFLPSGVLGLMIAGMLAAYVSTISTHLNWGTSYLVHDVYRRFVKDDAAEAHYVAVGRVVTALLMVVAALLTYVLDSAKQSFELMMSIGAGTGLLYLLRWFWWRVSAWSEIAAMVVSFAIAVVLFILGRTGHPVPSTTGLLIGVAITTVAWVAVAWFGPRTDDATLDAFYRRVRPAGPGWGPVQRRTGLGPSDDSLTLAVAGWVLGCAFVYALLFGTGSLLYGARTQALVWGGVLLGSGIGLARVLPVIWRSSERGATDAA
ncbi:MAG: hypothetical protein MUF40_06825 [Gemmatimonadaceae bacterium]|nr:hypothetical protein [Gemmatimonadaceae bacterium]